MYDYKCEYCDGMVKEKLVKKEVFKHRTEFVMLEDVKIGVCDSCGYRYYDSKILKRVDEMSKDVELGIRKAINSVFDWEG